MLFLITFQCREDFLSGKIHEFENDGQNGASRVRAILFEITYFAKQEGVCPKKVIDRLWVHFLTENTQVHEKILSSWWIWLFWYAITFLYHTLEKERAMYFERRIHNEKNVFGLGAP